MSKDTPAELGDRLRRELTEGAYEDIMGRMDEFDRPYQEMVGEGLFGTLWKFSDLSDDMKLKLNVSMLTVLGQPELFESYIRVGVKRGISFEEFRDIIIHAAAYAGFPKSFIAIHYLKKLREEILAEETEGKENKQGDYDEKGNN